MSRPRNWMLIKSIKNMAFLTKLSKTMLPKDAKILLIPMLYGWQKTNFHVRARKSAEYCSVSQRHFGLSVMDFCRVAFQFAEKLVVDVQRGYFFSLWSLNLTITVRIGWNPTLVKELLYYMKLPSYSVQLSKKLSMLIKGLMGSKKLVFFLMNPANSLKILWQRELL